MYGDQFSLFGAPLANSVTTTLPWPSDNGWVRRSNPALEAMLNFNTIFHLHDIATVIERQLNQSPVLSVDQPDDSGPLQSWEQGTLNGVGSYLFAFTVGSVLDALFDPSGTDFVFTSQPGTPSLSLIDMPALAGVASYDTRYEVGGNWSSFSLVQPGTAFHFALGTNAVEFIAMNARTATQYRFSNFLFDITFANSGTVTHQG